jgi:hypothetical protein
MPDTELPQWLDKTSLNAIGVLTLDDGKQMTVELIDFDLERSELVVDLITPNRTHPKSGSEHHAIPASRIVSFEPQSPSDQPWPYSDPCRSAPFSLARFAILTTTFLGMIVGGLVLFLLLAKKPYGIQAASAIVYTLAEVFLTFAATRGHPRYLFTCPAVQPQIPRLLLRHLGFLVALFILQTAALATRPNLPAWWNTEDAKGGSPFEVAILFLCIGLGYAQVFFNRSLLDRAHREFSA